MAAIGIMGGTFDPIHNGHLLLGRQAYMEYGLDQVWFMPSKIPPHKKDHIVTAVEDRMEMVRLAVSEYPYFVCSDFELRRQGNTYTADTLKLLHLTYPKDCFYFIIGADSLYQIEQWYHPEEVMSQAILLVAYRECGQMYLPMEEQIAYLHKHYGAEIHLLHCEEIDISSGELRELKALGKELCSYVPECVEQYIEARHLYRLPTGGTNDYHR